MWPSCHYLSENESQCQEPITTIQYDTNVSLFIKECLRRFARVEDATMHWKQEHDEASQHPIRSGRLSNGTCDFFAGLIHLATLNIRQMQICISLYTIITRSSCCFYADSSNPVTFIEQMLSYSSGIYVSRRAFFLSSPFWHFCL